MYRTLLTIVALLPACGSTRPAQIELMLPSWTAPVSSSTSDAAPTPRLPITDDPRSNEPRSSYSFGSSLAPTGLMPASMPPREIIGVGRDYTTVSLGAFEPDGDLNSLDTGFWGDVAFGRKFLVFLALEASVGYFETSGSNSSEVYGIPAMLDARFGIPILIFEGYLGAGLGGAWVHSNAAGLSSEDDFVGMWDGFVGLEAGLGGFNLGLEYKYVQTDKAKAAGGGTFGVEGSVISLTGTIPW